MARRIMRDGWCLLRRSPGVVVGEIVWRWLFGATALVLAFVSLHTYFLSIEITDAEYRAIKSLEPFTWVAIAVRVFSAFLNGLRIIGPILVPALCILWIALATIGRAATMRSLALAEARTKWPSLTALNLFRVLISFAAVLAYFGSGVLAGNFFDPQQDFGAMVLVQTISMLLLTFIWSVANWFFSTAAIFAAKDGAGVAQSFAGAAGIYHAGVGRIGTVFSVIRAVAVVFVTLISFAFAANLANGYRRGPVIAIVLVSLAYSAFSDLLYMWRLATYIALTEPAAGPTTVAAPPPPTPVLDPTALLETPVPSQADTPTPPSETVRPEQLKADS